ncbi:MAG: Ku protein [Thermodesulfovibrionales bacterium]|nr:Ku protein [Thermodesulfovibrionales bacterium]
MKALWSGNITFGLVNIPVKLYGAIHRSDISFHLLHKKCSTPVNYEKFCPSCNVRLEMEDIVRGYEYEKGKFVILTEEELEAPYKDLKNIEIVKFFDPKDVDPIYFEKSYYLQPAEGAERAYILLRTVMKKTGKVGIVRFILREREHIGILRIFHNALTIQSLFYADEIIKPDFLNIPEKIHLDEKEIELAEELIKYYTGKFNINDYKDEYREELIKIIKSKIAGKEVKIAPKKEVEKVVNLMDALKKSLEKKKKAV